MFENVKVAVIVDDADAETYRRACEMAEQAWDAGAEVRVRRARLSAGEDGQRPDWSALPREIEEVPELHPDDIGWADVVVSRGRVALSARQTRGASARNNGVLDARLRHVPSS